MENGGDLNRFCRGEAHDQPPRSWLYRVPLDGGATGVAGLTGEPLFPDAMTERDSRIRILVHDARPDCGTRLDAAFVAVSPSAYGSTATMLGRDAYATVDDSMVRSTRFAEDAVVLFDRDGFDTSDGEISLIPLARPDLVRTLTLPHATGRVEPLGGGILVTGTDAEERLAVSFIPPGPASAPSSLLFQGFTEDRDYGYVSAASGSLVGVPSDRITDERDENGRRRDSPDIQFLQIEGGRLARAGMLAGDRAHGCGSCGARQSRAIFMNGRIFALAGAELIEGRLEDGQVRELRRFDIAAAISARAAARPAPQIPPR
jgi:hypothetical protein